MMTIHKTIQNGVLILEPEGRLNSQSAPALEAAVDESINDADSVIFDFTKVEYLSSAGLRILLTTQQTMEDKGLPDVTVRGADPGILEVFRVTGFDSVLNIE